MTAPLFHSTDQLLMVGEWTWRRVGKVVIVILRTPTNFEIATHRNGVRITDTCTSTTTWNEARAIAEGYRQMYKHDLAAERDRNAELQAQRAAQPVPTAPVAKGTEILMTDAEVAVISQSQTNGWRIMRGRGYGKASISTLLAMEKRGFVTLGGGTRYRPTWGDVTDRGRRRHAEITAQKQAEAERRERIRAAFDISI